MLLSLISRTIAFMFVFVSVSTAEVDEYVLMSGILTGNYNKKSFELYVSRNNNNYLFLIPKKNYPSLKIKAGKSVQFELKFTEYQNLKFEKTKKKVSFFR